ncbi:ABC transporter substrate-binding protein [Clostridium sp. MT-14]|jgi:peptide/nickel transport system substrate-binding protein|uniref:ABC transporter substrate-binding protein n=1 Tax=Clostridium aromativorans TaxID=2836848 RepID=A0ABS8N0P0_9CLOT|nr:ABC transporter substrate-binding protein [Clostridium aromativorans]MCC9293365.1 ABC transporter substrate-binding protein [Clostridium aromativorans]CAB1252289.1 Peptide/nickel transport system substrate-binding protein [Clostridiaceae bacterium BL-3]
MKNKICFLAVFMMILSLFTGCGGSSSDSGGSSDGNDVAYYAYNSEPILNWDPSVEFSNGVIVLNNVYETLLRFNPTTKKYDYVLATSYKKSSDGLVWTFKLRKGVKFHDGTTMTADAVKYSIERTQKKEVGASYIWAPVKEIKAIDDYTVQFTLNYAAPLDMIASCPYAAFIISPKVKDKPDNWLEQGNEDGTGPYKLSSNKMGDEVVLSKFNDYWKGWNGKHFSKAVIKKTSETSSRRQMVEKGDADITNNLPAEDVKALKSSQNVKVDIEPSFTNLVAFFNTKKAPLDNEKVREALTYAFPYENAVKYAAGGLAKQSTGVIPVGMWGHGDSLTKYSLNLDKAKSLLKEAGINEGQLKLSLTYMSGDESEKKTAELYKSELSKIGVNLEVRAMPWESQWQQAKGTDIQSRQDILMMYWWPDISSPYSWAYNLFHSEKNPLYNLAYYSNSQYDQLVDDGYKMSSTNIEEAENKFIDAQKILLKDNPAVFIYDKEDAWITNSSLGGFKANSAYPLVVFFYDCYRK